MSDVVKGIKVPVRLAYTAIAGRDMTRFYQAIREGKLLGRRCPSCRKVYVPPRGPCPTCGVATVDEVAVRDTGTVTTFCIVNVPYEGQTMKLPYVYAMVLLDGADLPLPHLVQGLEADQVRMGLRVRASWAPAAERPASMEAIRWFEPSGEPDASYDSYREHL